MAKNERPLSNKLSPIVSLPTRLKNAEDIDNHVVVLNVAIVVVIVIAIAVVLNVVIVTVHAVKVAVVNGAAVVVVSRFAIVVVITGV